jgi:hypothetical protein
LLPEFLIPSTHGMLGSSKFDQILYVYYSLWKLHI